MNVYNTYVIGSIKLEVNGEFFMEKFIINYNPFTSHSNNDDGFYLILEAPYVPDMINSKYQ